MMKKFEGENLHTPENLGDEKYDNYQAAMDEEALLTKEIDRVFATTPSREEAEKIIMETLVPKIEEARKKSSAAYKEWSDELKKL